MTLSIGRSEAEEGKAPPGVTYPRATLPLYEAEVFAILNEPVLRQRLIGQSASRVDATWLWALLPRTNGVNASRLPDWRCQLHERAPYL